uniref:Glycoprotein hormone subunit beta domain-containing protein n=1 Tax=Astatotilapia calliptera TaxID=8154 RepID=A0AAX7UQ84_ASTCA
MQLVVMAAVLALAGAEQDCSSGCRPKNISLPVDTCGTTEFVDTTICEGQCFQKDPNYVHTDDGPKQKTCNGEWSYEGLECNKRFSIISVWTGGDCSDQTTDLSVSPRRRP